ncbi:MAG: asparagine synthase (glutamine-hydrolyzing) [Planctomycetia bacterium]|nr:asparagine synthase (glutamine-hydrolyzing) [Planctomycetia bacterium]
MGGIAALVGTTWTRSQLEAMVAAQHHRGPDAHGFYYGESGRVGLGHNRLSIIDLSDAGRQPMSDGSGQRWIAFNGEVYNYRELRSQLGDYPFRSHTDTEVVLAAFDRWGHDCLDHLNGMFAFVIWDEGKQQLFAARDRFGVKPLYCHSSENGDLMVASEIKALHAAGVPRVADSVAWASYLSAGSSDSSVRTFWEGIQSLPPGHAFTWERGKVTTWRWYDLAERCAGDVDPRDYDEVREEYLALLADSIQLRFRADVPVGINLSGGLDSSTLLGLVDRQFGTENQVQVFTYVTGDPRYDELPWVQQMLAPTQHPLSVCTLRPEEIPELALEIQHHQDEPFGGFPTLAYAKVFERARQEGVTVLLDGQGMDEQWAGYDYYRAAANGQPLQVQRTSTVQGTKQRSSQPECLSPEFLQLAEQNEIPRPFSDALRNLQYRDTRYTKIPKALRFNDRVSMRCSTELREPFLDHRLFELAVRQPPARKIVGDTGKWMLRQLTRELLPQGVVEAPKRPLQTPQREWLRDELHEWCDAQINVALQHYGGIWLDEYRVRSAWQEYQRGQSDNSFYIWQWLNLGLSCESSSQTYAVNSES